MPEPFKKNLIGFGLFLIVPAAALWLFFSHEKSPKTSPEIQPISHQIVQIETKDHVKIPIEIIEKGGNTEQILVDAPAHAVPEPTIFALFGTFGLLLLLRRKR